MKKGKGEDSGSGSGEDAERDLNQFVSGGQDESDYSDIGEIPWGPEIQAGQVRMNEIMGLTAIDYETFGLQRQGTIL